MQYFEQAQSILAIIGAVMVGLPALLHALHVILLAIPGEQKAEKHIEKLLKLSEKLSEIVKKVYPQPK